MSSTRPLKFAHKEWLVFTISILILTDLAILLNIPFLRQVFGFLSLTILPGLLILQILKLNKIDFLEKFILSWGISISFLMFFGLLINNLSLNLGYESPLSTISLLIMFNIAFIVLAIIGYKTNDDPLFSFPNLNLSVSEKAFLIVPILFPALSILGTHLMKTSDNNIILMFMLFLIPIYVVFVCFFNHKFPKRLYPVVIFSISISLLLIVMLRFPHIYGSDVHTEYYLFRMTLNNLHWSIVLHSTLDACLGISLLPAIYQSILNVNAQEYLFKGVYVSICSLTPLAIYATSKRYIGELYAFLASFFFISQRVFIATVANPRTTLAIFFVALAVMVFFNDKIDPLKRRFLFILFIFSVVVSHYSTAYLFFFTILFTWFAVEIFSKRYVLDKKITLTGVLLFFAFIFFWYSQIAVEPFNSGIRYFESTFLNLNRFFIVESRSQAFEGLCGQGFKYGIVSRANFIVTWSSFILIGIGVLTILKRYKEIVSIPNIKFKKPDFLKTEFEMEYLAMAVACAGLLGIMVALPYVSIGYGIERLYSFVIIILSVCFVIGGMTLSKHFFFFRKRKPVLKEKQKSLIKNFSLGKKALPKKQKEGRKNEIWKGKGNRKSVDGKNSSQVRAYLIILVILIPYFLLETGTIHQIFGTPVSINLNSCGELYNKDYLFDQESCSARWLAPNIGNHSRIYSADRFGQQKLISLGEISPNRIDPYSFFQHAKRRGYIYLCYNNVVKGKLEIEGMTYNMSEYSDMFIGKSKIYDTDVSQVYY